MEESVVYESPEEESQTSRKRSSSTTSRLLSHSEPTVRSHDGQPIKHLQITPELPPIPSEPPSRPPSRPPSPQTATTTLPTALSTLDGSSKHDVNLAIREEQIQDRMAVSELIRQGFAESEWADKLAIHQHRVHAGYLVLSLVSLDKEGGITGHIAVSTLTAYSLRKRLEASSRRRAGGDGEGAAVLINPLVVLASHQDQKIGSKLVYRALELLASGKKGRFQIAFVQGPVGYYEGVLGFDRNLAKDWSVGLGGPALMARWIRDHEDHGSHHVSRRVSKPARPENLDYDIPDEYGIYNSDIY